MRFAAASKNNASNYATAGAHIINASTDIQQAIADRRADYTGIALVAQDATTLELIAATKAKVATDTAGVEAVSDVTQKKQTADASVEATKYSTDKKLQIAEMKADDEIKKSKKKMAGRLATLGALGLKRFVAPDPKKAELPKFQGIDYSKRKQAAQAELATAQAESDKLIAALESGNLSTDIASAGSQASIASLPTSSDAWSRFSPVIRAAEGTTGNAGYNTMFGGGQFTDLSRHPDHVVHAGGYSSAAAGAYQFMPATWNRAAEALGLKDFSPASQEAAGRWLVQQRGVDPDAIYETKEQFAQAIDRLAPEWAGLPNLYGPDHQGNVGTNSSYYGQGGKSLDTLWNIYQSGL